MNNYVGQVQGGYYTAVPAQQQQQMYPNNMGQNAIYNNGYYQYQYGGYYQPPQYQQPIVGIPMYGYTIYPSSDSGVYNAEQKKRMEANELVMQQMLACSMRKDGQTFEEAMEDAKKELRVEPLSKEQQQLMEKQYKADALRSKLLADVYYAENEDVYINQQTVLLGQKLAATQDYWRRVNGNNTSLMKFLDSDQVAEMREQLFLANEEKKIRNNGSNNGMYNQNSFNNLVNTYQQGSFFTQLTNPQTIDDQEIALPDSVAKLRSQKRNMFIQQLTANANGGGYR